MSPAEVAGLDLERIAAQLDTWLAKHTAVPAEDRESVSVAITLLDTVGVLAAPGTYRPRLRRARR